MAAGRRSIPLKKQVMEFANSKAVPDALTIGAVTREVQQEEEKHCCGDHWKHEETMEEQVARESYLQWLREQDKRSTSSTTTTTATRTTTAVSQFLSRTIACSSGCQSCLNDFQALLYGSKLTLGF